MKLTEQQQQIVQSKGNICINATAGAGKTSTLVELVRSLPRSTRVLYIAFNKSVKLHAVAKFAEHGVENVVVETAHSLAYKTVVSREGYRIKPNGYTIYELPEVLNLLDQGVPNGKFITAYHIIKYISLFCNSKESRFKDCDYLATIIDEDAKKYVGRHYEYIRHKTYYFLKEMFHGHLPIIHDFYLKRFQLDKPVLAYDVILFDEGQDASPAMLDVFQKQSARKIIVGDTHQQIYSWRYAINSLEQLDFPTLGLTASFRFPQDIADLAVDILEYKNRYLGYKQSTVIRGVSKVTRNHSYAVLARTNLTLLLEAITIVEQRKPSAIYFEGNISAYAFAESGTSLYDVLNLYCEQKERVRDPMLQEMGTFSNLEEYVEQVGDGQLKLMIEVVKEYGMDIPRLIKSLKDLHVDEKAEADIVFSTVHKAKGMEYDVVELASDFIKEADLEKQVSGGKAHIPSLVEEVNLLYVAVTRATSKVIAPESILPKGTKKGRCIEFKAELRQEHVVKANPKVVKTSFFKPMWPMEDDLSLMEGRYIDDKPIEVLASQFRRSEKAIRKRLAKLDKSEDMKIWLMFQEGKSIYEIATVLKHDTTHIIARLDYLQ